MHSGQNLLVHLFLRNYFLAWLSMVMFVGLVLGIFRALLKHGTYAYFCDGQIMWGGDDAVGFFMTIFYISKYPELLDTVLLVVRGRKIRFLHW